MKIEDCIFYQLSKANQAGLRFLSESLAPSGVTAVQGLVLNFLFDTDEITSSQLGRRTKLDSATLTGILDRLEATEIVERRAHPVDRRAILVCLTRKGKKVAADVHTTILRANRELLAGFEAAEEKALRGSLQRLHQG